MTKFFATENVERLDRFELIAELASGGMATVFLARLGGVAGFQRFVAIKRLHPHLAGDRDFIEMFLDEARIAARLHHPHVVPILEIGESEKGYYLVMEYIEGDTLARLMARSAQSGNALPARVAVRAALDALAGLHAAHEMTDDEGKPLEIVHRDVSPQNILVGVDGSARIADFGVARAASRLTTTKSGQLKGKLSYMAPEQARGKGIDRRADVFAMGIVLWELLARKRLFKGDGGEAETLNKVMHEPIPHLRDANPELPEPIVAVCMQALERDIDKRFKTAAIFAETLEKAAIDAGLLGAHRDVAAHLELVIGTDISQQRDAVRAWLARSEPSRQGDQRLDATPPPAPASSPVSAKSLPNEHASLTRIDGARASRIHSEGSKPSGDEIAAASSGSLPLPVPNPIPRTASRLGDVSSVSSAILSVPGTPGTPILVTAPPPRKSRGSSIVIAVLLLIIVGGGFYAIKLTKSHDVAANPSTPTPTQTQTQTTIAPPPNSATATTTSDKVDASIAPSSSASTTLLTTSTAASDKKRHASHAHAKPPVDAAAQPSATPTAAATTSATPDDISHNPYR
ncbi:MAG: serine/threonine-protein kinase [Polyangiaceae bacterium]